MALAQPETIAHFPPTALQASTTSLGYSLSLCATAVPSDTWTNFVDLRKYKSPIPPKQTGYYRLVLPLELNF
jgi:hypothetical protein